MTTPPSAVACTTSAAALDHRRPVDGALLGFFLAAYLLPWAVWWSQIADERGWTTWHLPGGVALWTLVPVTLAAVAATGGRAGLVDLSRRLVRWRVPGRWWAAAVGLPLGLAAVATGIGAAITGSAQLGETLTLPAALTYLGYGVGLFLLTEEAAWRGFALPRLMTRLSPLAAAGVLGVIWAGWHIPTFLLPSEADSAIPYWGFAILTIATSVITAWLYVGSGGSVLLCALFHAVADAVYSWTGVVGRDHSTFWAAVVLEVAVAVWLAAGGSPHDRARPSRSAALDLERAPTPTVAGMSCTPAHAAEPDNDTGRSGSLPIAEVAELTGLSKDTLRYYEKAGLIQAVGRSSGGQRRYAAADLDWLAFLLRLRATGMSIADMRHFAELRRGGNASVPDRLELLARHRDEVRAHIASLQSHLDALDSKITHYQRLLEQQPGTDQP